MSHYEAYFLGVLTIILIMVPFWILTLYIPSVKKGYKSSICYKICD